MKCTNGKTWIAARRCARIVLLLVVAGCKSPSGKGGSAVAVKQALVGKDGARTVTAANTIVNRYSALVADAAAGTSAVTVNAMSDLATDLGSDGGLQPLAVGDLLLVIQMAGATIDSSDTRTTEPSPTPTSTTPGTTSWLGWLALRQARTPSR